MKNQYRGGTGWNGRGLGQFAHLRRGGGGGGGGAWQERGVWCFWRGRWVDTPIHTMNILSLTYFVSKECFYDSNFPDVKMRDKHKRLHWLHLYKTLSSFNSKGVLFIHKQGRTTCKMWDLLLHVALLLKILRILMYIFFTYMVLLSSAPYFFYSLLISIPYFANGLLFSFIKHLQGSLGRFFGLWTCLWRL